MAAFRIEEYENYQKLVQKKFNIYWVKLGEGKEISLAQGQQTKTERYKDDKTEGRRTSNGSTRPISLSLNGNGIG